MLNILLTIILIILFLIIVLLYFGIKISLIYDKTDSKLEGCLQISILRKIKLYSLNLPSLKKDKKNDEDNKKTKNDIKQLFKLLKPCFEHFKLFLKSFMKCIRVQNLENHLIFGMDSYTDTAKYIGYIWSFIIIINSSHKNAKLSAEPSFNGSVFNVNGVNEFEINILKLIPPVLRLISKKEVRTLIKEVKK